MLYLISERIGTIAQEASLYHQDYLFVLSLHRRMYQVRQSVLKHLIFNCIFSLAVICNWRNPRVSWTLKVTREFFLESFCQPLLFIQVDAHAVPHSYFSI